MINRLKKNKKITTIILVTIVLIGLLFIYNKANFPSKDKIINANKTSIEAAFLNRPGSEYINEIKVGNVERIKKNKAKKTFLEKITFEETYSYNVTITLNADTYEFDAFEMEDILKSISAIGTGTETYVSSFLYNRVYLYDVAEISITLLFPNPSRFERDAYVVTDNGQKITQYGRPFDPVAIEEDIAERELRNKIENKRYDAIVRSGNRRYRYEFVTWDELESAYKKAHFDNHKRLSTDVNRKLRYVSPPAPPLERHQVDIKNIYEYDPETGEYIRYPQ